MRNHAKFFEVGDFRGLKPSLWFVTLLSAVQFGWKVHVGDTTAFLTTWSFSDPYSWAMALAIPAFLYLGFLLGAICRAVWRFARRSVTAPR